MRILAYSWLPESYRSLALESLRGAFGVNVDPVDNELSGFTVSGIFCCSIDEMTPAVNGIMEMDRPTPGLNPVLFVLFFIWVIINFDFISLRHACSGRGQLFARVVRGSCR